MGPGHPKLWLLSRLYIFKHIRNHALLHQGPQLSCMNYRWEELPCMLQAKVPLWNSFILLSWCPLHTHVGKFLRYPSLQASLLLSPLNSTLDLSQKRRLNGWHPKCAATDSLLGRVLVQSWIHDYLTPIETWELFQHRNQDEHQLENPLRLGVRESQAHQYSIQLLEYSLLRSLLNSKDCRKDHSTFQD